MVTDRCQVCDVAVAAGRWLCLDHERLLPQASLDALRAAAAPLRQAQEMAVKYLKGLDPLPCAEHGCPRPRGPGRRTCLSHSETGRPRRGVEDLEP